ncbi:MAG: hypothetical protein K1X66_01110 [Verrucomicrobiae bacterium]|nr:hypothetical protein [Verrucomicrobiae bacterium]
MFLCFFRHVLLWSLLFLLSGGHHCIVQGVAWGKMVIIQTGQNSLWRKAEQTFSGKKSCSLCRKAAEAREKEHQQDNPYNVESFQVKVSLFAFLEEKLLVPHRECLGNRMDENKVWHTEEYAPATPPPKLIS